MIFQSHFIFNSPFEFSSIRLGYHVPKLHCVPSLVLRITGLKTTSFNLNSHCWLVYWWMIHARDAWIIQIVAMRIIPVIYFFKSTSLFKLNLVGMLVNVMKTWWAQQAPPVHAFISRVDDENIWELNRMMDLRFNFGTWKGSYCIFCWRLVLRSRV